jgi:subtilisin family serine protease
LAAPAVPLAATPEDVYTIALAGPISADQRRQFEALDIHVLSHEPPNKFLMYLTPEQLDQVARLPFVIGTSQYTFEQTVTPDLLDTFRATRAVARSRGPELLGANAQLQEDIPDQYDVICHRPEDVAVVKGILERTRGATVVDTSDILVRCKIALDPEALAVVLAGVAALPQVAKIAPYRPPALYSDHARRLIGVDAINQGGPERWTGQGELVAIFDSGVDDTHPDLADRIHSAEALPGASSTDVVGHGTHVAGIIAGTGAASGGQIKGMAPGARLAVFGIVGEEGDLQIPADLAKLLQLAVDKGAKIINLSWGMPLPGPYDGYSMSVDKFLRAHPDVLVVVAGGNKGRALKGTHEFNTVGTPATAKNVLTVGACASDREDFTETWGVKRPALFPQPPAANEQVVGNPDLPAALSSRGPTDYSSVKPDLMAPGTYILSTRAKNTKADLIWAEYPPSPDRYFYTSGTSMAAPIVSGAAAIVRQYLREELDTPNPSAALVKALLVAAAKPVPSLRDRESDEYVGYPDFDQGFGRLDLSMILPGPSTPATRRIVFADVANDSPEALESRTYSGSARKGRRTYTVTVPEGAMNPLRIVLTWTDYAALHVQNNLELVLTGPGIPILIGNASNKFGKNPCFDTSDDPDLAGLCPDKPNSVELLIIDKPEPGEYRVRVIAENTPFPPQGYALCVCGELASGLETDG